MYNTPKRICQLVVIFQLLFGTNLLNGTPAEGVKYVVEMPNCRIPDYDPFDKSIVGIPSKWPQLNCSAPPPLTSVTGNYGIYDSRNGKLNFSHTLHLHPERFYHYNIPPDEFECCYKLITRDDSDEEWPDDGYKLSECANFRQDVTFNRSEEFIWVRCDEQRAEGEPSPSPAPYVNVHAFIGSKPELTQKLQSHERKNKKLNVMIVGFDSMSRLNLLRTMPKTVEHLTESGWYDLKGYNKVGDNTFPNLMAAFAGMNLDQVEKSCWPTQYTPLDDCPIIWKTFSDKGYVTAYGEDQPKISSFNSIKAGFKTPPTDYYLRPFFLAAHKNIELKEIGPVLRYQHRIACFGPTKVADHMFEYSLDFLKSFSGVPTFSIFWQNGFSHEHLNGPSALDETVLDYFKKLADSGALNSTMILFMSDHGFRFDEIRHTFLGYVEERLPFMYFWLPDWYKKTHRHKVHNLARNRNMLTSPFDVYMTLLSVIGVNGSAPGCEQCRDLFHLMPWNRTCADAGIADHWCTCAEYSDIDTNSPLARKLATLTIETIHQFLIDHSWFIETGTACARLGINNVISVKKKKFSDEWHSPQMVVVVETFPGYGQFEATLSYSGAWKVMGDVSRINKYGDQSACVHHKEAQKYCFCIPY